MLEYENTKYSLENGEVFNNPSLIEEHNRLLAFINENNKKMEELTHFKNEEASVLKITALFIPFYFILSYQLVTLSNPYFRDNIIGHIFASLLFCVLPTFFTYFSGIDLFPFLKKLWGKRKPLFKTLETLGLSLNSELKKNQQDIFNHLSQKNNQHEILNRISEYYYTMVTHYSEDYVNQLGYMNLREQLIESFVDKDSQDSFNIICEINKLIRNSEQHWIPFRDAQIKDINSQKFLNEYNQYLKTENKIDAFEYSEGIDLKKII